MKIPVAQIASDPENVRRFKPKSLEGLTENIRFVGLLQPLTVRVLDEEPRRYVVIDGHRRFAAIQKLGWTDVECFVRDGEDTTLAQVSANVMREDMEALDVFRAVTRLVKEGKQLPAIAAALNITERQASQWRAMGDLHPKILAHIEKHEDIPHERALRVICQADHKTQAEAFKGAVGPGTHANWGVVAERCRIQGFVASRLPKWVQENYDGPVHTDLFDEEDARLLTDTAKVRELADTFIDMEQKRAERLGFKVAEAQLDDYGSLKTPPGCESHPFSLVWNTKKADRKNFAVTFTLSPAGHWVERMWKIRDRKAVAAEQAKVMAPLTTKGVKLVEQAKRDAAAWAITDADTPPWPVLALILGLMLRDRMGAERYGDAQPEGVSCLLLPDGGIRADMEAWQPWLLKLAADGLDDERINLTTVERIGHYLQARPSLSTTNAEVMAALKRPAIELACKALGLSLAPTQKASKEGITRKVAYLTEAELPQLAWKLPLPAVGGDAEDEGDSEGEEGGDGEEQAAAA